jgi:hypothetical protein
VNKREAIWNTTGIDPSFRYIASTGRDYRPSEMATPFVYNALRKLWEGRGDYEPAYRKQATANLYIELSTRARTPDVEDLLFEIAQEKVTKSKTYVAQELKL